jgi:cytochrome P450
MASRELDQLFAKGQTPLPEPMFVALSQTMPRLLTNSWLALAQHPAEFARLRGAPQLIGGAVEELLRFAGIVRRVFRRATAAVEIGGVPIPDGQLVILMLASANHDCAQFPDANRLDVTRAAGGHVSLGSGRNSCVGAGPIRMALTVATSTLVTRYRAIDLCTSVEWRVGSGFWFPAALEVTLLT